MNKFRVHGVTVRTSKEVQSRKGSRLEFTDGSWCDVSTGMSHNQGPGDISFEHLPLRNKPENR